MDFIIRLKLFLILCDFTATMEAAQRSLSKHLNYIMQL